LRSLFFFIYLFYYFFISIFINFLDFIFIIILLDLFDEEFVGEEKGNSLKYREKVCKGCGSKFQKTDIEKPGYLPEIEPRNHVICQR
jgi:hypothetical protein